MSAGSILMSAAVEILFRHLVAGEIVNRAQADPYRVWLFRVLAQRDAEFHSLYLKRHVHQSFRIAFYKVEMLEVLSGESEI